MQPTSTDRASDKQVVLHGDGKSEDKGVRYSGRRVCRLKSEEVTALLMVIDNTVIEPIENILSATPCEYLKMLNLS